MVVVLREQLDLRPSVSLQMKSNRAPHPYCSDHAQLNWRAVNIERHDVADVLLGHGGGGYNHLRLSDIIGEPVARE